MQDLNLRPLACHAHISCSPTLSDVQISANRSTFCPLRFAGARSNFLALLTALLTECLLQLTQGVITFVQRVIPKRTEFSVEFRPTRLDIAPSATHDDALDSWYRPNESSSASIRDQWSRSGSRWHSCMVRYCRHRLNWQGSLRSGRHCSVAVVAF